MVPPSQSSMRAGDVATAAESAMAPRSPTAPERQSEASGHAPARRASAHATAALLPASVPPRCSTRSVSAARSAVESRRCAQKAAAAESPSFGLLERSRCVSCEGVSRGRRVRTVSAAQGSACGAVRRGGGAARR
eukprot:1045491-Prymnesium_polylepis.1